MAFVAVGEICEDIKTYPLLNIMPIKGDIMRGKINIIRI